MERSSKKGDCGVYRDGSPASLRKRMIGGGALLRQAWDDVLVSQCIALADATVFKGYACAAPLEVGADFIQNQRVIDGGGQDKFFAVG